MERFDCSHLYVPRILAQQGGDKDPGLKYGEACEWRGEQESVMHTYVHTYVCTCSLYHLYVYTYVRSSHIGPSRFVRVLHGCLSIWSFTLSFAFAPLLNPCSTLWDKF